MPSSCLSGPTWSRLGTERGPQLVGRTGVLVLRQLPFLQQLERVGVDCDAGRVVRQEVGRRTGQVRSETLPYRAPLLRVCRAVHGDNVGAVASWCSSSRSPSLSVSGTNSLGSASRRRSIVASRDRTGKSHLLPEDRVGLVARRVLVECLEVVEVRRCGPGDPPFLLRSGRVCRVVRCRKDKACLRRHGGFAQRSPRGGEAPASSSST